VCVSFVYQHRQPSLNCGNPDDDDAAAATKGKAEEIFADYTQRTFE